jgi:type VI secretion system protein ImpH
VAERLFEEGYGFDFFQAVRLLERIHPERHPVGRAGPPQAEAVRFAAHLSLSFPPSPIYEVEPPSAALPVPRMAVTFMGLTGPSGVLPRHYTELLLCLEREGKGPDKRALRAWLDLFNHRLIALFYRAWEKYRFYIPYERGEYVAAEPDPFTRGLFSLVGMGFPAVRDRLRVAAPGGAEGPRPERVLARVEDLALLHYSGFFAHRPRCAVALEALLQDYFALPVQVLQFQGQWLVLDPANRSRVGGEGANNQLGVNLVVGERVWDVQGKIRLRLGPLDYAQFNEFLPDRAAVPARKAFFLLCHLVRLYVGPELDFDVQLVLKAEDVPACRLDAGAEAGARLGWNTWIHSQPLADDADDAVFEGEEVVRLNGYPALAVPA